MPKKTGKSFFRDNKITSRIDYGQLFIVAILGVISLIAIYSAQQASRYGDNFIIRQVVFYVVGFAIAFVVMQFDHEQLRKASWYGYGLGIFMLVVLMLAPVSIAEPVNGAKAWFQTPIGSIQPSEFMKIFLIITLANVIQKHNEKFTENKNWKTDFLLLLKLAGLTLLPIGFIMLQPDLGTSIVIIAIFLGMTFVSGITYRLLLPIVASGGALLVTIFYFVMEKREWLEQHLGIPANHYQFRRIDAWLYPYENQSGDGFQLVQSMTGIGSGQVAGKGFLGREIFLPEAHSDFIFAIIGEEYGFIGASIVIVLFFLLIFTWIRIALETKETFNSYLCAGIISLITFHVFQNIGMTIGLLPITGIPLPFVSYGGSSLWASMMGLGLIFSIRYHHKVYMFGAKD